ncbi:MAG TPA: LamG-like jellyroll fold domain-containing protein [Chthoniobacteraceae bacterium]|nr:LamG-like jellyroll fold domain-containing protein [Chthoniobacteraceae bacterium]
MSCLRIFLLLLLSLSPLPGQEQPLFEWFGEGSLPGAATDHPAVVKGELGVAQELQFSCSGGNPGEAQYITPSIREGTYDKFTITLFIKPERKRANETLVYLTDRTPAGGMSFRKSWKTWGLVLGRDGDRKVHLSKKLEAELIIGEWNHLAVTFNDGVIKFYRNGLLVDIQTSEQKEISVKRRNVLRIGAGTGITPKIYDGFQGRMGAIYLSLHELDEAQIHQLMERAIP